MSDWLDSKPLFFYRDYLGAVLYIHRTPRGSLHFTGAGVTIAPRDIPRLIAALQTAKPKAKPTAKAKPKRTTRT